MDRSSVFVAALLSLFGCGGGSASPTNNDGGSRDAAPAPVGDDAGSATSDGSSAIADAGSDDTSLATDGEIVTPSSYTGQVLFDLQSFPGDMPAIDPVGGVVAMFGPPGSFRNRLSCLSGLTMVGPCCYVPPSIADAGAPAPVSAGELTATLSDGGLFGTAQFGAQGYIEIGDSSNPSRLRGWDAGDTLDVAAAGATVMPFSSSVVAPEFPANVMPSPGAPTVSLSADWTVSWTPGTASGSTILVELFAQYVVSAGYIKCSVDDSVGTVTISTSLLSQLKPVSSTSVSVSRAVASVANAGADPIQIIAVAQLSGNAKLTP